MDLYIANTTKQHADFYYRLPEVPGAPRCQRIPIGGQVKISGSLSTPDIDAIIAQHAPYGMVPADALDTIRGYVGLCYSVGKPVPAHKIERAMNDNITVLVQRGAETRKAGAVASSMVIEDALTEQARPEILRNYETTIVEENPDARGGEGGPAISEGIRVNRAADPDGNIPAPSRHGKRRKAA